MLKLDLFSPRVPTSDQHPIFRMLVDPRYGPERELLALWAEGFVDRDGKFVDEFQRSFEPCFWELYVFAALKRLGFVEDFSHGSPDFVLSGPHDMVVEATVARPAEGQKGPVGYNVDDIPDHFAAFNRDAVLRICNSFSSKVRRYRNHYSHLPHCRDKPFVIAIGAYDRPGSHFAASRGVVAAMYGIYFDEDETRRIGAENVVNYRVRCAIKTPTVEVPVGLFCDDMYSDVSAVVYSALATWGKLRALAVNPGALSFYKTFHPSPDGIEALIRTTPKSEYIEDLLDGIYVLHNPHARHPIPHGALSHDRLAELRMSLSGELAMIAPDDMLLLRFVMTVTPDLGS